MKRLFVEKKPIFNIDNQYLIKKIKSWLNVTIEEIRIIDIYDIDNIDNDTFNISKKTTFSDININYVYEDFKFNNLNYFAFKNIAAQFDIKAESAIQCIKILNPNSNPKIWTSKMFIFPKNVNKIQINKIKNMLINKIDMEEKDLSIFGDRLISNVSSIKIIKNFCNFSDKKIEKISNKSSLTYKDWLHIRSYFLEKNRDPTETELKLLETYWSDHCRHTTFETEFLKIDIKNQPLKKDIQDSLNYFLKLRNKFHPNKPITLMNLATVMTKQLQSIGKYQDVEISDEINACSIFVNAKINNKIEKWLVQFKNETHNHPTEIEPFGGAATCLGGAIRDPLSGRSYVYQGFRVSGAGNSIENVNKTMMNKLPQQQISRMAAEGFSSYGNQIGIATAFTQEINHSGYKAKRMEVGFVVGASPAKNIIRKHPDVGDIILLIGGRTGRDGIGGATGSSKEHTDNSLLQSSSEVQKGNPIEERKIQRLFRNEKVTKLIKKSNDFGAGGISVAVGELADSLNINLDLIPLKYKNLNGNDIAFSESQERMAILIDPKNLNKIKKYCDDENIESTCVGEVTNNGKLIISWKGNNIVDIDRVFLNTNGAKQNVNVMIDKQYLLKKHNIKNLDEMLNTTLSDLNVACQKGIQQLFDYSIGNSTVLAPYGGIYQLSPSQVSVQKLPVGNDYTDTSTMISFGYDPYISTASPYIGGMFSVVESLAKIVAAGGNVSTLKLSFQEYYEKLNTNPIKWGKPFASLLGAMKVMKEFEIAAIGGKDSMSGTFKNITVPPTLISFALSIVDANNVISTDLKKIGNYLYLFSYSKNKNGTPNLKEIRNNFVKIEKCIIEKKIISAFAVGKGGIAAALAKMSFGNNLGFNIYSTENLFDESYGTIIVESYYKLNALLLGKVSGKWIINKQIMNKDKCLQSWTKTYNQLFPLESTNKIISNEQIIIENNDAKLWKSKKIKKPKILIPVFPGTNCEFDMERKFTRAGGTCEQLVFCNKTEKEIKKSIDLFAKKINSAHVLALSGGFSASDEPNGSGKFIVNILKNKKIKKAIDKFRKNNGFIIGICNGFQALIKSGLLPYGEICDLKIDSPTLFKNDINSHISKYINTKVSSIESPWLMGYELNQIHTIPISHGEGKFIVNKEIFSELLKSNQIAFQYVDNKGKISSENKYNPNGSNYSIEGIISKDGMILGKMGHSERYEKNIAKNIYGNKNQNIFANIIRYLKGEQS